MAHSSWAALGLTLTGMAELIGVVGGFQQDSDGNWIQFPRESKPNIYIRNSDKAIQIINDAGYLYATFYYTK